MTFGLTVLPVMFVAGLALDYSQISREAFRMQETADSAALYAVKELEKAGYTENDLFREASANVTANIRLPGAVEVNLDAEENILTVNLTRNYEKSFLKLMDPSPLPIHVTAKVKYKEVLTEFKCMMTLSETGKGVFAFNGNAVFDAPNCGVHVNSRSADAVDLNGAGTAIISKENCFVGGVQSGLQRIQPSPLDYCYVLPDPFDEHATPKVGSCDYTKFSASGNQSIMMQPGVYCGGIALSSGIDVTLAEGLYIVKNGPFKTTGHVNLVGKNVTFYFVGDDVELDFSGNTEFNIVAMDEGVLAGFVVFFDQEADMTQISSFSGNSSTYFEGLLYFGRRNLTIDGEGEINSTSPLSGIIANTVVLNGNGTIHLSVDPNNSSVPIPEELFYKDISPRLIQ